MPQQETLLANAKVFDAHNKRRLQDVRGLLDEHQRKVFDVLPLLLHEEIAGLPGNREGAAAPSGISCFSVASGLLDIAGELFPGVTIKRRAKTRLPISFLALMGSAGTLAFTKDSDFDFWVGIEASLLGADGREALRRKLEEIEEWAERTAGLEVHFFVVDAQEVRRDDYGELKGESCGTALGRLLKDEFYRTGIFLEGKRPFYWVMPPGVGDEEYVLHVKSLCSCPGFPYESFVDLGNVLTVPPEEYFGAALWQILKGLRWPFKSVVKIALLDKYSHEGAGARPLCDVYKEAIFTGAAMADPYVFMIESLRRHFSEQRLASVRRLIEECFLVRGLLSCECAARREALLSLGRSWEISEKRLGELAAYREWDGGRREELHRRIIDFLVGTYRRVRERTRSGSVRISERDLTVLGKKLASFFERKENKIPYEFLLFDPRDITGIAFRQLDVAGGHWTVSVSVGAGTRPHLVRSLPNALVACAWCSHTRLYHDRQFVAVEGGGYLTSKEASGLMTACDTFFPVDDVDELDIDALLSASRVTHLLVLPNHEDPDWNHDVKSMLALYRTTMGEMLWAEHRGADSMHWLRNEILFRRIGKDAMRGLNFRVHHLRGEFSSTRRICESVAGMVAAWMRGP